MSGFGCKSAIFASLLCVCLAGTASAATIAFENDYTTDNQAIAPDYGSLPGLTVSYTDGVNDHLLFWTADYSGHPAAYAGSGVGAITFTPSAGHTVTLDDFFLGGWPNTDRNIAYSVDDLAVPGIELSGTPTVSGSTGLTVLANLTSGTGIRITFGPDGYDGGINYLHYSVSAVPVPAALPLFGSALGALGLWSRRRKSAAV